MKDFQIIMASHGFTDDTYDFDSTIAGFDYDIHFVLLDENSIFDVDRSQLFRQWNNPSELVRVELLTLDGNLEKGLRFFHKKWLNELRYQNPVKEITDIFRSADSIVIRVLMISQHNAITLLFNIR